MVQSREVFAYRKVGEFVASGAHFGSEENQSVFS